MKSLQAGDRFGDYKVVRLLGKGGMGAVFLLQTADGRQIAAKILDASSDDHEARRRFLREAQLALGVKHANLVEVYDVGEDPDTGLCYILMEYVPGGSLADYLKEQGALPIEDAVAVVEAMAQVLELARQKGIVHRDIKPANIMFDAEGTPKLADLGIARGGAAGVETTTVTQTGVMIGTPAYMAPEQMLDAHNVDTRADIYSLGVVFFEMLTGERPNKDDTVVQLMAKAVKGEPLPDVRTLRPEVSASLAQLLAMMVAPDKEGRISTPGQITNALGIIERGGKLVDAVSSPRQNKKESTSNRRGKDSASTAGRSFPWKILIPVAILVALAVAFAFFGLNARKFPPSVVRETVVVTNIIEKDVVQVRTVTNVSERIVKVRDEPAPSSDVFPGPVRTACERRVGHILIRSDEGVRQDVVGHMADWIGKMLPQYRETYGDPYAAGLKGAPFVVRLAYESGRPSSGSYRPGYDRWVIFIGNNGDWKVSSSTLSYMLAASLVFAPERNWASLVFYANHLHAEAEAGIVASTIEQGRLVDPEMKDYDWRGNPRRQGVPRVNGGKNYYAIHQWRSFGPLEELRKERPSLMRDYFARKQEKAKTWNLTSGLSVEDEIGLFSEVMGKDVRPIFKKYGWPLVAAKAACRTSEDVKKVLAETRVPVLKLVKDMPMTDAVDILREVADNQINFVIRLFQGQHSVKQSFVASDITLKEALALVCDANDYLYGIHGNVVLITSKDEGPYRWIDIPKTPLADKLRQIVIPEVVIKPPMTIADVIQIFVKAERQMYNLSSIVLATQQVFDISSVVMPTMKLRGCSYFDALDIVCQSVDFTFTVDKRVTIKTKILAEEQRKHEERMEAGVSKISDYKKKSFKDRNAWNAMRKTALGLFPGWRLCASLQKHMPKDIPANEVGYFDEKLGFADVLSTVGDGDVLETAERRMIQAGMQLHCWVMGNVSQQIAVKVGNEYLQTYTLEKSKWTEISIDLSKFAGKRLPISLSVIEKGFRGLSPVFWTRVGLK